MVVITMTERDDIMHEFGPLLVEAFARVTLTQINNLRAQHGQPAISLTSFLEAVATELDSLEPYDWMEEET